MELLALNYEDAFRQTKRVYGYEHCGYEWVYIGPDNNYYVGTNPTSEYRRWSQVSAVLYSLKNYNDITRFP